MPVMTPLEERTTEHSTAAHPVHWVCVAQWDLPFIALCGNLPSRQRRTGVRVDCPDCLTRIHPHAATCALCAHHAKRY